MKMQNKHLLTFLFLFISTLSFSQKISIGEIYECRSTSDDNSYDNKCEIGLKISGDEVRKYKFVKISSITKATDDQDLDLLKEDAYKDFEYEQIEEVANLKFETKVPSHKATFFKELSGEISLYNPSEANGSIIKVSNYQTKTNTNLLPNTAGLQIMYLTKQSMEKYTKEHKEQLESNPNTAEGLIKAFEEFSDYAGDPNQAIFYIEGDQTKLTNFYFEDAKGEKIDNSGSRFNNIFSFDLKEKPNPTWKLVIVIETETSVKKVPFKLVNIELP